MNAKNPVSVIRPVSMMAVLLLPFSPVQADSSLLGTLGTLTETIQSARQLQSEVTAITGAVQGAVGGNDNSQVDPNLTLRPPSEPTPTRAEMEAAKVQWERVVNDRNVAGEKSEHKFTLIYVYPTSPWSEMRKKQYVNNSWVDTVVSRSRVYSASFQNQEGKYWNNRFYLVEKAPLGVYFGERWGGGGYEYALPASAMPKALTKEAALKYQNVVKAK